MPLFEHPEPRQRQLPISPAYTEPECRARLVGDKAHGVTARITSLPLGCFDDRDDVRRALGLQYLHRLFAM